MHCIEGRVHSTAGRGAGLLSAEGPVTLFILLVALSPSDADAISLYLGITFRRDISQIKGYGARQSPATRASVPANSGE